MIPRRSITRTVSRKEIRPCPSIAAWQANELDLTLNLATGESFDGAEKLWLEIHTSQTSDPADVLTSFIVENPTGNSYTFPLTGEYLNHEFTGVLGQFWINAYATWNTADREETLLATDLFLHRHNASLTTPPPPGALIPLTQDTADDRYAQLTDLDSLDDRVSDLEDGGGGATAVTSLTIGGVAAAVGKLTALNVKAPAPVVIYFHGSGENEGTPFNGTGAPITSALMAAGCIVMSSSGGGVSQWGNTTEINAYKALVDYAITNYNPSGIYFIGQSMGAIAALNLIAAGTVQCNGFWGVYPATNLSWCYANGFAAQIEAAYGFSGSGNYAAATSGHDPYLITAASFAGSKYTFVASSSDTTISKTSNTDLFQTKLAAINLTSSVIQHTGNHGDSSAFIPASVVEFCDPMGQAYSGLIQRIGQSGNLASVLGIGGPTGSGAYVGTYQDRAIFGHNVCYDGTNWRQFDPTHASSMWLGSAGQMTWWAQSSGNPTDGLGTLQLTLQPGSATFNGNMVVVGSLTVGGVNLATSKMDKSSNLSDVTSPATARSNLGLGAMATSTDAANLTGNVAVARIATALTTPGPIGESTPSTVKATQVALGVGTITPGNAGLLIGNDIGTYIFIGRYGNAAWGFPQYITLPQYGALTFSRSQVPDGGNTAGVTHLRLGDSGDDALIIGSPDGSQADLKLRKLTASGAIVFGNFTVGTVPDAPTNYPGGIYVSNESGGGVLAFSDGTNWRRVTDRAIIS